MGRKKHNKSKSIAAYKGENRRRQILDIVATDNTFKVVDSRFSQVWVGKCLMCKRKLTVWDNGRTTGTVEHILARNHGGDHSLSNVALACASCNSEKGRNHDKLKRPDMDYVGRLLAVRQSRWREPNTP